MECPTCGEYGDLLRATVPQDGPATDRLHGMRFRVAASGAGIDPVHATDVASLLAQAGLDDDWDELERGARLAAP